MKILEHGRYHKNRLDIECWHPEQMRASRLDYAGGGREYVFLKKGEMIFHCFAKSRPMIKQRQHWYFYVWDLCSMWGSMIRLLDYNHGARINLKTCSSFRIYSRSQLLLGPHFLRSPSRILCHVPQPREQTDISKHGLSWFCEIVTQGGGQSMPAQEHEEQTFLQVMLLLSWSFHRLPQM